MGSPPVNIEIPIVPMHAGVNLIIHEVTDTQNQYFQTLQLHVTSLNDGQMETFYTDQFFYDTTQGLLDITTFTIQPTVEFVLQAHFNGLIDYNLDKVYIGYVEFDNSNCPSLNQIIKSEVNLVCDLSKVGFETQQYLAHLIQHNFIPVRYVVSNSIYQFTTITMETQLMTDTATNCIDQPQISLNWGNLVIHYSMQQTNRCINHMTSIRISIGFKDQTISQRYKLISHFMQNNIINFHFILQRSQHTRLKYMQPYDNITVLTIYQFESQEIKMFDNINRNEVTTDSLVISTMKFNSNQISIAYTLNQFQTANLTIKINFFFEANILANIYLTSPIYFHSAGEIKFTNDDIKQDYNPETYIINPTIKEIYNKMIKSTSLYVIIEGVEEVQTITNFINTDQYLNSKIYLLLGIVALVQILLSSIFFALSNRQY